MDKEQKEIDSLFGDIPENWVEKSIKKSGKAIYFKDRQTFDGLHFFSALVQLFLGITVILLSVMELIQPGWLATMMTVIGSISIFTGLTLFYSIFSRLDSFDSLINKAIKRVILFQN